MPIGPITQGSKENIQVIITDNEETVTDLSTAGPKFDVMFSDDTFKYGDGTYANAQAATAVAMTINCIVDTTSGGIWAEGDYRLFVWFTVGSEVIRKGPFFFPVEE